MIPFPGIEAILNHEHVFRSLGGSATHQRFGAGFMNKTGVREDNINHFPPYYVIVYVLHGRGTYIDDQGRSYPIETGDFFQRFAGRCHSTLVDPDSGWREGYLALPTGYDVFCRNMGIYRCTDPVGRIGLDQTLIARLWRFKENLKNASEDNLPSLAVEGMSLAVEFHRRLGLTRHQGRMAELIEAVCEALGRDFHLRPDLPSLFLEYGCGYESFRKQFSLQVGVSPGQYRIRRRLEAACGMLSDRRYSISEISWMLGYSSPFEFSAQFKRHTGVSPLRFRGGKKLDM